MRSPQRSVAFRILAGLTVIGGLAAATSVVAVSLFSRFHQGYEQIATAKLLANDAEIDAFHAEMKPQLEMRLQTLYDGVMAMKERGLPVDAIEPMGAIYLTARFDLVGRATSSGTLQSNENVRRYLLEEAGVAIIPFQAFGTWENTGWFRLAVGAVSMEEIQSALPRIEAAIAKLS